MSYVHTYGYLQCYSSLTCVAADIFQLPGLTADARKVPSISSSPKLSMSSMSAFNPAKRKSFEQRCYSFSMHPMLDLPHSLYY